MRKTITREDLIRRATLMLRLTPDGRYSADSAAPATVRAEIKACDTLNSLCFFCDLIGDATMQAYYDLGCGRTYEEELAAKVNFLVDALRK